MYSRMMFGHANAGDSDLAGRTLALEDSLYLDGIDPK